MRSLAEEPVPRRVLLCEGQRIGLRCNMVANDHHFKTVSRLGRHALDRFD